MLDPRDLYELDSDPPELDAPVLLCLLDGFVDAGGVAELAKEKVFGVLDSQPVARFEVDRLIDYRSRRPTMTFVEDHWEGYEPPELTLRALTDEAGQRFLLLSGPEPDHEWERFTAAVCTLVERFGVRSTVVFHGIPMAVPHTRPVGLTAHATRRELIAGHSPWLSKVQVPGSASALLEFRLGLAGRDALGFAVHVPHYLAQLAYPAAALVALDAVATATGLALPLDGLRAAGERADAEIAQQMDSSEEVAAVVRALEEQYDSFVAARERDGIGTVDPADLPTAEELGAQFERFLADRERRSDSPDL